MLKLSIYLYRAYIDNNSLNTCIIIWFEKGSNACNIKVYKNII